MKQKGKLSTTDLISVAIVLASLILIGVIFTTVPPRGEMAIYSAIGLVGSIASTGGLFIAIIQILALKKTYEATQSAIDKTEKELSIMKAIESATNCFNQLNQIDEYLETMNIDSIKTLLPIATQNYHELILFKDHNLEQLMQKRGKLSIFLESFAGQLTIMAHHKNVLHKPYNFTDKELTEISMNLQETKAFANIYRNALQQAIVQDET